MENLCGRLDELYQSTSFVRWMPLAVIFQEFIGIVNLWKLEHRKNSSLITCRNSHYNLCKRGEMPVFNLLVNMNLSTVILCNLSELKKLRGHFVSSHFQKQGKLYLCLKNERLFLKKRRRHIILKKTIFSGMRKISTAPMTNCIITYVGWSRCSSHSVSTDESIVETVVVVETFEDQTLIKCFSTRAAGH